MTVGRTQVADVELAQCCADIYEQPATGFDNQDIGSIAWGHRKIGDHDVVVFRGSYSAYDWYSDFRAFPVNVPHLGFVHHGFYKGMPGVVAQILPKLGESIFVTGHSLGAARAWLFGALLTVGGRTPRAIVAFATPRPGLERLRDVLCMSGARLQSYRNSHDPVTNMPLFPFIHPVPPTEIYSAPADDDRTPLRCHHMVLYIRALKQMTGVE